MQPLLNAYDAAMRVGRDGSRDECGETTVGAAAESGEALEHIERVIAYLKRAIPEASGGGADSGLVSGGGMLSRGTARKATRLTLDMASDPGISPEFEL